MIRKIKIFDISAFIYSGSVNEKASIKSEVKKLPSGEYYQDKIPSGGIAFLFNQLLNMKEDELYVFAADREARYKKSIYPDYKENRGDKKPEVERQKEIAEIILKNCGFQVVYAEDYEGDDVEYSICRDYKDKVEKIELYNNDRDLCIVIDDNVDMLPSDSRGKVITKENFEFTVASKNIIPWNTLTYNKFLYGCRSDNVKPLPKELRQQIETTFNQPEVQAQVANREYMREMIELVFPDALDQFEVIYPVYIQDIELDFDKTPNKQRINEWAKVIGNRQFPKVSSLSDSVKDMKESLFI